eukprot:5753240-Pyramimonas_sp.AAC.2
MHATAPYTGRRCSLLEGYYYCLRGLECAKVALRGLATTTVSESTDSRLAAGGLERIVLNSAARRDQPSPVPVLGSIKFLKRVVTRLSSDWAYLAPGLLEERLHLPSGHCVGHQRGHLLLR